MIHLISRAARLVRPRRMAFAPVLVGVAAVSFFALTGVSAGNSAGGRPNVTIAADQTDGFGSDRVGVFTYFMNFMCVHEPGDDLDNDGQPAKVDPDEFQSPRCVVGRESTIDPAGGGAAGTEPLYVLLPWFDADGDAASASPEFADVLTSLFGFVPDAFDPTPGVDVQCPEPGPPLTAHTGAFGPCTMHPTQVDVGPLLGDLDLVPDGANVQVPLPNHSHLIRNISYNPVWWQIIVVLVTDESEWPGVDGTTGITSVDKLRDAQAALVASGDIPTNFFLFFDSMQFENSGHSH